MKLGKRAIANWIARRASREKTFELVTDRLLAVGDDARTLRVSYPRETLGCDE
jgi:hypothetical protein